MKSVLHGVALMGVVGSVLVLCACGKSQQPAGVSAEPPKPLASEPQSASTPAATAALPSEPGEQAPATASSPQSRQTPQPASRRELAGSRASTATTTPGIVRQPRDADGESRSAAGFHSSKPLYVKLALGGNRSEMLSLAFDESKGTGRGYDRLYADLNHNGKFEQIEASDATTRGGSGSLASSFPVSLGAGRGSAVVHYGKQGAAERFLVSADIGLNQGGVPWQYSLVGQVKPSGSLSAAPTWGLSGAPQLRITTKPDLEKKGNLGIALELAVGETQVRCTSGGKSPEARIAIKDSAGQVVHQNTATADKFTFG